MAHHGSAQEPDLFGRTAMDVACLQRWGVRDLTRAMAGSEAMCAPGWARPAAPDAAVATSNVGRGGWLESATSRRMSWRCDIDAVESLSMEDFLIHYLSIQRPVLVRNAQKGKNWDRVRKKWTRANFDKAFGHLVFESVTIPYAK